MAVIHLTKNNFEKEVHSFEGLVLIDFWAPWCPPCRMLGPIVEELSEELDSNVVKVCKVNVDEEGELAQLFQVTNIPLLVVMQNGKVIKTSVGYKPKEEVLELLK